MTDKVQYWLDLAKEDISVAQVLLDNGKFLHCGFFCHLIVEKALKAKIAASGCMPPKEHNLLKLAELGLVLNKMSDEQKALLAEFNPLQLEARYPSYKQGVSEILIPKRCVQFLRDAKEMVLWIEQLL